MAGVNQREEVSVEDGFDIGEVLLLREDEGFGSVDGLGHYYYKYYEV